EAPGWTISEAALIQATDELYNDAIISDATWKILSKNYTEEQLIDVIFTVGQYNMVSWALNSLGVQLEEGVPGFPEEL
ncbi:MAG: carboxymuconolactone decarboxylase family protein, partial [bacterium]